MFALLRFHCFITVSLLLLHPARNNALMKAISMTYINFFMTIILKFSYSLKVFRNYLFLLQGETALFFHFVFAGFPACHVQLIFLGKTGNCLHYFIFLLSTSFLCYVFTIQHKYSCFNQRRYFLPLLNFHSIPQILALVKNRQRDFGVVGLFCKKKTEKQNIIPLFNKF